MHHNEQHSPVDSELTLSAAGLKTRGWPTQESQVKKTLGSPMRPIAWTWDSWPTFRYPTEHGSSFGGNEALVAFLTLGVSKLDCNALDVVIEISNLEGLLWRKYTGS